MGILCLCMWLCVEEGREVHIQISLWHHFSYQRKEDVTIPPSAKLVIWVSSLRLGHSCFSAFTCYCTVLIFEYGQYFNVCLNLHLHCIISSSEQGRRLEKHLIQNNESEGFRPTGPQLECWGLPPARMAPEATSWTYNTSCQYFSIIS